jgi:Ca2+/H+ antiporter, TMEM165/GDT1 family
MDLKMLATTFGMIFLAELGDKTQLATFCMSADCNSTWTVFIGSAAALVLSSFIAAFLGEYLSRFINPLHVKILGGIFFLVVGGWMLTAAIKNG